MKSFDRKFGTEFVSRLPKEPGVYRVYSAAGELVYVGKAKNLRRRLSQYRNAKRRKRHHKMRAIIADAARIDFEVCATELDAFLLETRLIQQHRPRWNVASAFHFLYPMIGLREDLGGVYFCYTNTPESFPDYRFHGAYRSRHLTKAMFHSLMELLEYVGHPIPRKKLPRVRYSIVSGFRQLSREWVGDLERYFRGESLEATEELVLALVENAGARRKRTDIQERLNDLARFWKHEARPLRKARLGCGHSGYPVPQAERDPLFLRFRNGASSRRLRPPELVP